MRIGMKSYVDYVMTGAIASLMLLVSGHPGFNNDAHAGEEDLSVTAAGKTVVVTAGYGTTIAPGEPPAEPTAFSRARLDEMLSQLLPPPPPSSEVPSSLSEALKIAENDIAMGAQRTGSARKLQDDRVEASDR